MKIEFALVTKGFWARWQTLAAQSTLWEQLAILKGKREGLRETEYSHVVENFQIAAGESDAPYKGTVCSDSELGKWIEAAAYSLARYPDEALTAEIDGLIALILRAQMPDGYINTYFQVLHPGERLKHFGFNCELYNIGHLMEAAAAYHRTTGKRDFLDGMCHLADLLDTRIGPELDKAHVYDGHAEIELGLLALYRATGVERYLRLAEYFVRERGKQPSFLLTETPLHGSDPLITDKWFGLDDHQAHIPVAAQRKADGHAVKVTYLFRAVTEIAQAGHDEDGSLNEAVHAVWENMVNHRMYITGAIGSQGYAERFTVDNDLPSDHGYLETCASVGIAMWGRQLLKQRHLATVADVVERALYNGMLSGWSLDGSGYFYTNMLHCKRSVMTYRQDQAYMPLDRSRWFACACCPSNVLRVVCSIEDYLFSAEGDTLYLDGYMSARIDFHHESCVGCLELETEYPYDGMANIALTLGVPTFFRLAFRKPGWCDEMHVIINEDAIEADNEDGYLCVARTWQSGDRISLRMTMSVNYYTANPDIWDVSGRAAMAIGPLIYCVESIDNPQGINRLAYSIKSESFADYDGEAAPGVPRVRVGGWRLLGSAEAYQRCQPAPEPCAIFAVPYFAWGNRGAGDMDVWLPYRDGGTEG